MKVVERDLFAEYDDEAENKAGYEESVAPAEEIETAEPPKKEEPEEPVASEPIVVDAAEEPVAGPIEVDAVEPSYGGPIEVDAVEPSMANDYAEPSYIVYEAIPVEEYYSQEQGYEPLTDYATEPEPVYVSAQEQEVIVEPAPEPFVPQEQEPVAVKKPKPVVPPEPESPMKGGTGQLFRTFFKIGIVTFGGGYAMIPMIESEVVNKKQWVEKEQFLDLIAIAQTCPGVFAINISTFIGYKLRKTRGALLAALGAALPSFLIILAIAMVFRQFQDIPWVAACFKGIRPAVVALIAVPTFNLAKSAKINLSTCWIPIVGALLICLFDVNPIFVILGAAFLGYLYGMFLKN